MTFLLKELYLKMSFAKCHPFWYSLEPEMSGNASTFTRQFIPFLAKMIVGCKTEKKRFALLILCASISSVHQILSTDGQHDTVQLWEYEPANDRENNMLPISSHLQNMISFVAMNPMSFVPKKADKLNLSTFVAMKGMLCHMIHVMLWP